MHSASWRSDPQQLCQLQRTTSRNSSTDAKEIRKKFMTYFNGVGAVPWQHQLTNNNTQVSL